MSGLYDEALKSLAQAAHGAGRLASPDAELRLDNPLCGDRIDLQVSFAGTRIAALAYEIKGCLLCRAAASVVGLRAPGCDDSAIAAVHENFLSMLNDGEIVPAWPEWQVFAPVREHPSRRGCVALPLDALARLIARRA